MIVSRRTPPRKKKRGGLRFLFAFTTTTAMIATGGFGAFPDNPMTQSFQQVISENFSADFLQPFNSYMELVSVPTIQPQPASASENDSSPDPLGFFQGLFTENTSMQTPIPVEAAIIETAMASIEETQTQLATVTLDVSSPTVTPILTQTQTQTSIPTQTSLYTQTSLPTATLSPLPTKTLSLGIVLPTSTKKPPPANTSTFTPTLTPTATVYPAGYSITNVAIDGISGATMYYSPGVSFTVTYDYSIWSFSDCPGCIFQIVTGLGTGGVGTNTCGYDGQPGVPPGISGSANIPMTAPVTQGTYTLNTESQMQYACADAINAYGGSGPSIGEILIWGNANIINVWSPGTYDGNLGGRAGADAICVATKNPAFANANVHALISISSTDSIANMPAAYGISSGIPLVANYLIAKNWSDLLDGSINTSFAQNGVGTPWWSGTENASGIAIPATSNCLGFTSNAGTDSGNAGNSNTTGTGWANTGNQQCNNIYALICIAAP